MHAALPRPQFVFAVSVVQREHGRAVPNFDETLTRLATDTLGRGIRCHQLRMFGFQLLELGHQPVELGVAEFGLVQDVVPVLVIADLVAQGF